MNCGLKFAEQHVGSIIEEDKTVTARHGGKPVEEGHIVPFFDEGGERFGSATIEAVYRTNAIEFVEDAPDGHRAYEDVDEFLDEMCGYYPDETIRGPTMLWVVEWSDFTPADEDHFGFPDFDCPRCDQFVWQRGLEDGIMSAEEFPEAFGKHRDIAHCGVCGLEVMRRA